MKNIRKLFAVVLALAMVCTMAVAVYAAENTTRGTVIACSNCENGTMRQQVTTSVETKTEACSHGMSGKDVYERYVYDYYYVCGSCGHSDHVSTSTTSWNLVACNGH